MHNGIELSLTHEQVTNSNRLDLGQNYSMVTETYEAELEQDTGYHKVVLMLEDRKSGEKIDFAKYLNQINPERKIGVRFAYNFTNQYGANERKAIISIPKNGLKDPKDIAAIMHEWGHVIAYEQYLEKNPDKAKKSVGVNFREGLEAKNFQYTVEQDAWKQGVLQSEVLNKEFGFNIFSFFENSQEFCDYIYHYLGNYKKEQLKAGSQVEYKTLYDKRFEDFLKSVFDRNKVALKD